MQQTAELHQPDELQHVTEFPQQLIGQKIKKDLEN